MNMTVKRLIAKLHGANVIKLFCPSFTNFLTELECLSDQAGKACQGQTL